MTGKIPVGIFAASSIVPKLEFEAGLAHLREHGFEPRVEAQVTSEHFIFPGDDAARAEAIHELAFDPTVSVLWAARGGYGAGRLLPLLEKMHHDPIQRKLLIGYSDVTVLHEFVRTRWGWSTLHAPMPAASNFSNLDPREWQAIMNYVKGEPATPPWLDTTLRWMNRPPHQTIRAELIGGNLSLWAAVAGTRFAQDGKGKIIFLEDVDEPFYRIDRMMVQLEQSGMLDGAAAVVLGDFASCKDEDNQCLADRATGAKKPLRKVFQQDEAFEHIFTELGRRIDVPIAIGLPVGHGPHYAPLPLGARYELTTDGKLKLLEWDWLSRTT
jgi:muramoyltetrapeptide carboxypeptidase